MEFVVDHELAYDLGSERKPFPLENWIEIVRGMM